MTFTDFTNEIILPNRPPASLPHCPRGGRVPSRRRPLSDSVPGKGDIVPSGLSEVSPPPVAVTCLTRALDARCHFALSVLRPISYKSLFQEKELHFRPVNSGSRFSMDTPPACRGLLSSPMPVGNPLPLPDPVARACPHGTSSLPARDMGRGLPACTRPP